MSRDERIERWTALMAAVRASDVAIWRDDFVRTLTALPGESEAASDPDAA